MCIKRKFGVKPVDKREFIAVYSVARYGLPKKLVRTKG